MGLAVVDVVLNKLTRTSVCCVVSSLAMFSQTRVYRTAVRAADHLWYKSARALTQPLGAQTLREALSEYIHLHYGKSFFGMLSKSCGYWPIRQGFDRILYSRM